MEKDIFANVSNAAKSAARYTAQKEFVGLNGEKIAALAARDAGGRSRS